MTALLLQTLMLMVPAFFIGAALACGLRRLLAPDVVVSMPSVQRASPGPVEPLTQYAGRAAAPREPVRPAAVTSAPQVPMAPAAVSRFDDALKTRPVEPPRPAPAGPAVVASPAAVAKPIEGSRPVAPPPPPAPPAAAIAPKPVEKAVTVAPVPMAPVTAAQPATSAMIASAAAAAAAAAAAVATQARTATIAPAVLAPPAAVLVAPVVVEPAARLETVKVATPPVVEAVKAVAPTPLVEPVRVQTPAAVPPPVRPVFTGGLAGADDLTRISVIEPAMTERLRTLGVTQFSQIAGWRRTDVASMSAALGFQGRIEQENWIEQAQILANGGDTYYSARRGRAQSAVTMAPVTMAPGTMAPVAAAAVAAASVAVPLAAAAIATSAAAPSQAKTELATTLTATAPEVATHAAFAHAAADQAPVAQMPAAVAPATGAAATAVVGAAASALAAAAAAAASSVQTTVAKPTAVSDTEPAAAAPVRPAMAAPRDNLQRIGGINAEIERLLGGQSITRYGQISSWGTGDVERFDRLLGSQGRIARENWVEQAQMLAKGGDTAHSRDFDRRAAETPRDASVRPVSIADAIKANTGAVTSKPDIGALRSVRSEAYRAPAADAATMAAAAAAAGAGSAKVVRSAEIDDLKRIRGIGVLIEKRLNSVGVVSYGQIAEWTNEDIDRVSATLDFKGRIERENWVEQSRILASGGQTEFSRRVDRGEVETSKTK